MDRTLYQGYADQHGSGMMAPSLFPIPRQKATPQASFDERTHRKAQQGGGGAVVSGYSEGEPRANFLRHGPGLGPLGDERGTKGDGPSLQAKPRVPPGLLKSVTKPSLI